MTIVRARSTWAAAVTRLKAVTRSWGFTKAAACSPRVILPEELFSTEPWQPVKRKRKERQGQRRKESDCCLAGPEASLQGKRGQKPQVVRGVLNASLAAPLSDLPAPVLWHNVCVAALDFTP